MVGYLGNPLGAYLTAEWQMQSLGRDRNCSWFIMDPVPQANESQRKLVLPALVPNEMDIDGLFIDYIS